jgi:hypothetical protein
MTAVATFMSAWHAKKGRNTCYSNTLYYHTSAEHIHGYVTDLQLVHWRVQIKQAANSDRSENFLSESALVENIQTKLPTLYTCT